MYSFHFWRWKNLHIGNVFGCSPNHLIIKSSQDILKLPMKKLPKIGTSVYDNGMTYIGKIADIFGPTSNFFISITPNHQKLLTHFATKTNERIYIAPPNSSSRSNRGKKRKYSKRRKIYSKRKQSNSKSSGDN
ncbi:MAG: hypothetical protein GF364_03290 [Candidatus Lokiarchaeota archaeon]|nr:hypothetical protein [Candidatus Lokiarchaeota archaeon]